MNLPERLQVGPFTFRVEEVERLFNTDMEKVNGQCDDREKVLRLESALHGQQKAQTFLHELLHALDCTYRMDLSHEAIDMLAVTLLDVLRRNTVNFLNTTGE